MNASLTSVRLRSFRNGPMPGKKTFESRIRHDGPPSRAGVFGGAVTKTSLFRLAAWHLPEPG